MLIVKKNSLIRSRLWKIKPAIPFSAYKIFNKRVRSINENNAKFFFVINGLIIFDSLARMIVIIFRDCKPNFSCLIFRIIRKSLLGLFSGCDFLAHLNQSAIAVFLESS